jgi:hypothetical protein
MHAADAAAANRDKKYGMHTLFLETTTNVAKLSTRQNDSWDPANFPSQLLLFYVLIFVVLFLGDPEGSDVDWR